MKTTKGCTQRANCPETTKTPWGSCCFPMGGATSPERAGSSTCSIWAMKCTCMWCTIWRINRWVVTTIQTLWAGPRKRTSSTIKLWSLIPNICPTSVGFKTNGAFQTTMSMLVRPLLPTFLGFMASKGPDKCLSREGFSILREASFLRWKIRLHTTES